MRTAKTQTDRSSRAVTGLPQQLVGGPFVACCIETIVFQIAQESGFGLWFVAEGMYTDFEIRPVVIDGGATFFGGIGEQGPAFFGPGMRVKQCALGLRARKLSEDHHTDLRR